MLPSAFEIVPALAAAPAPVLFLDFDGTLAPLVERPDAAILPERTRAAVARAALLMPVAIVSGRHLDDLRARVDLDTVAYAGSHGLEILAADGARSRHGEPEAFEAELQGAARTLEDYAAARDQPGLFVEHKPFSVAVHYPHDEPAAEAHLRHRIRTLAARFARLEVIAGKHVLELRPRSGWDKGSAIGHLLAAERGDADAAPRPLPVFIGDDLTDEDGFRAVVRHGYAVRVGGEAEWRSAATHALASPGTVCDWIGALVADRQAVSHGRASGNEMNLDKAAHAPSCQG